MPFKKIDRSLVAWELSFPARFRFQCLGGTFTAEATMEPEGCRLVLSADLGPVPFSAESMQARTLRLALFELDDLLKTTPRFVENKGHLTLIAETSIDGKPTAQRLVAAAVALVMRCRPELSLAAETAATGRRVASPQASAA
jgi:hypothetical protein